jgi:hypothetical protein
VALVAAIVAYLVGAIVAYLVLAEAWEGNNRDYSAVAAVAERFAERGRQALTKETQNTLCLAGKTRNRFEYQRDYFL